MHLPLRHKQVYAYRQTVDGESEKYTVTLRFIGGETTKVFRVIFDGIDMGECTLLQKGSSIVFETTQPMTRFEDPRLVPAFRQTWVNEPVPSGESWEDPDTGTRTVFAGYESVAVPAGEYGECYKTVTEALPELADTLRARLARGEVSQTDYDKQLDDAARTVVRWFAPNVGLVKEQIGSPNFVRELVAIKSPGDSG